ncbi:hypothetical protein B0A54_16523 [Friedmanniomyces endolithicus]|uniref:Acyl-CoA thioesterase-like N-terminal HotDog domain-containing protein n=1 Tax=Friedmanniomyces endolithicus TaxID=329885 RepID=A0A4U0U169_9PEZI|nr:hypothetical protein B0A54_16523 [Friedmanniomyces endolithicus]
MPPPQDGNVYLPFADLVRLEKVDDRTFQSTAMPFAPGGPVGQRRAYGGHVYMQAAWAACQTVAEGFLLHNVTGNFLLPGSVTTKFTYRVYVIRDGRSYATRIVNVTQAQGKGICFTCTCLFKVPETSPLDAQEKVDLWSKYEDVLGGNKPSDFEECPGMDVPWYWRRRRETGLNDAFPGLTARKVDMQRYNESRHPLDRRQLILYRTLGNLPNDPNMHLCAHLYASDRNSLYIVANHLDIGDPLKAHEVAVVAKSAAATVAAASASASAPATPGSPVPDPVRPAAGLSAGPSPSAASISAEPAGRDEKDTKVM